MHHDRRLPRYLAFAYALLTAYACLYPMAGWRDPGISPFAFLTAPWPRYFTFADLWLNVLGYIPLGFMLAASFTRGPSKRTVLFFMTLACILFSGSLEFAQNYRHIGEIGLILVGLWWLTQLEPTSTLFGTGDMRPLFDLPAAIMFSAHRFVVIESLIVSMNVLTVGLLVKRCMREPGGMLVALVLIGGLAWRSLADYVFIIPPDPWQWATPGALRGLMIGLTALLIAWQLPGWLQHSLACVALLLCTALVNIAPENPFELSSMRLVHENHFLNFHGLTRLADFLWPFLALIYLSANAAVASRR
jgi:hypothetical protein